MAVNNYSGLTINQPIRGIQFTKVTDTVADWPLVANSTYFYDKGDKLVRTERMNYGRIRCERI